MLVHCSQVRILWDLLLAIVGVNWVFPSLVRKTLLSWGGSLVGMKRKKGWRAALVCIFWTVWRERNLIMFDNKNFSAQRMKSSFLCNLWSWSNMYMVDSPKTLVDFLTWLGCK